MDDRTNLDDYLAGLGISDADESAPPPTPEPAAVSSAPTLVQGNEDPQWVLERFLKGLFTHIDPSLKLEITNTGDALEAQVTGENAAKLTGRDGRILGAIEVIAYTVLAKQAGRNDMRIRIDIGHFRHRQSEHLTKLAERLAIQVAKSGEAHELQPMPPAERRIIHIALKENPDVMSESIGEGNSRRLVIKPKHV